MIWRSVYSGCLGKGRFGSSKELSPASLCWSSAHLVSCELDEACSTWTWVQAQMSNYSLNRTKTSSAIQCFSMTSSPTRRWSSRKQEPFGLKSVLDLEIMVEVQIPLRARYMCHCLPSDRTWQSYWHEGWFIVGVKGGGGRARDEARALLVYAWSSAIQYLSISLPIRRLSNLNKESFGLESVIDFESRWRNRFFLQARAPTSIFGRCLLYLYSVSRCYTTGPSKMASVYKKFFIE